MNKTDKINCKDVMKLVSSYLDQDLDPEICKQIDTHMGGCKPCDSMLESLYKTVELCLQYEPNELPEIEKGRLRKDLEEELAAFKKTLQKDNT